MKQVCGKFEDERGHIWNEVDEDLESYFNFINCQFELDFRAEMSACREAYLAMWQNKRADTSEKALKAVADKRQLWQNQDIFLGVDPKPQETNRHIFFILRNAGDWRRQPLRLCAAHAEAPPIMRIYRFYLLMSANSPYALCPPKDTVRH